MTDERPMRAAVEEPRAIDGRPSGLVAEADHVEGFRQAREARRTELVEDYVELIADLLDDGGEARQVDIAARLGVAQPTVAKSLKRLAEDGRQMPFEQTVEIAASTADALDYAHSRSMIHRDIKPANVMLNVQGQPIVMYFGIFKIMGGDSHNATGAVLGT